MELTEQELQAKIDAAVAPLKDKRDELLGKLANFKKFESLDIDKLQADAAKLAEVEQEKLEAEGKWEEAYTKLKAEHQGIVDELKVSKQAVETELSSTKLENGVAITLMGMDIIPELADVAKTTLLTQAALNDEGALMFGDKTPEDFVKDWSESPVGKHFIKSGNAGGGGPGSDNGNDAATFEQYFKPGSVNATKQIELKNSNPEAYKILNEQYNVNKKLPNSAPRMGGY